MGALIVSPTTPRPWRRAERGPRRGRQGRHLRLRHRAGVRDLYINQATSEGIAKGQVDLIAKQIGDKGEIAILSAAANATNQNAWIDLMEKELAASHPDIELVDTVYGDDGDQTSFDKTAALLQSHPGPQGHHLAHHGRHRCAATCRTPTPRARSR